MSTNLQTSHFLCRSDNYGVLIHDDKHNVTATIDSPDADAILRELSKKGWTLTHIFTTHHHFDHVEGLEQLKAQTGAAHYAPKKEAEKISSIDFTVSEGDLLQFGAFTIDIIETPGHTLGSICYYIPQAKLLFSGDALFSLGCGRMFEGTPKPMWEGLEKLAKLPDDVQLFCGHEYSQSNAAFALSVDPSNEELAQHAHEINSLRTLNQMTIPVSLGLEQRTNPFLLCDDEAFQKRCHFEGMKPHEVFAKLRQAKDHF